MRKESALEWLDEQQEDESKNLDKRLSRLSEILGVSELSSDDITRALTGEHGKEPRELAKTPARTIHVLPNTPVLSGPKSYTLEDIKNEITKGTQMGKKFQMAIENHLRRSHGK